MCVYLCCMLMLCAFWMHVLPYRAFLLLFPYHFTALTLTDSNFDSGFYLSHKGKSALSSSKELEEFVDSIEEVKRRLDS